MNIEEWMQEHGIETEVEWADENPNMSDPFPGATHWLVTFKRGEDLKFAVHYSQGSAHSSEPEPADVLDCVASDVSSVVNEPDWLQWARDLGYESIEDAEKARSTYQTIEAQRTSLLFFLGEDEAALNTLLWEIERR